MVAVAIATGRTPAELRALARRERDGRVSARLLALANALDGMSRDEAARAAGMDRQTLRDWVHRYNAAGLAGLHDRPGRPGPKPRLTPAQTGEVARAVEAGTDLAEHGVVRWRRVDLRDFIDRRFGVRLHERTVGKLLRRLGFRRLSVRPQHPQSEPAAQEAFKKTSPPW
jgi:transposase